MSFTASSMDEIESVTYVSQDGSFNLHAKIIDWAQQLRQDFCPPIDEPVFLAICHDYDLASQEGHRDCVRDLEFIKAAALETDATLFDASGTGGLAERDTATSVESQSSHNGATSGSQEVESITAGLSALGCKGLSAGGQCLDEASEETKAAWLTAMFPDIAEEKIFYRLQKCQGNLTRTIDELLNLSFIDQAELGGSPAIPKGIDGFIHPEDHGTDRKGKGRRRMRMNHSIRSSSATAATAKMSQESQNVWESMANDVEFVRVRTSLSPRSIKAVYDAEGKSLSSTVSALASKEGINFTSVHALDCLEQGQVAELCNDFPTIPAFQLYGLLIISGNRVVAAHELAAAMSTRPTQSSTEKLEIIKRYPPININSGADSEADDHRSSLPWNQVDLSKTNELAMANAAAGSTAFAKARDAYRRGRSDRLMGAAAGYYATVGHENVKASKELSAQAAEILVRSQSSSTMLDLHGISVSDAVRISKEQVASWWDSLGDTKYAGGGGLADREGYRVVTGVGRHSRNGAPRIGPAVSRMLVREGWKVTVGQGEILVTGRARRS